MSTAQSVRVDVNISAEIRSRLLKQIFWLPQLTTPWFISQDGLRMHDLRSFAVQLNQRWASGMHTVWTLGLQHQLFLLSGFIPIRLYLLGNVDIHVCSFNGTSACTQCTRQRYWPDIGSSKTTAMWPWV